MKKTKLSIVKKPLLTWVFAGNPKLKKNQPGMVVQAFASELATAGDFVGMAVEIPLISVLSLIAVVHRLDIIQQYDKIAVMKSGKVSELGSYDELMAGKGLLYELVTAKK